MKRISLGLTVCAFFAVGEARAAYVLSTSDCPSSRGIQARLDGLVAEQGTESVRAMVEVGDKEIRIELGAYGERPRLRILPNQGTCDEKTDAVALVIAAWLDTLPANALVAPSALPPLPLPPVPAPVSAPAPPSAPARTGWLGLGVLGLRDGAATTVGLRFGLHVDGLWRGLGLLVEAGMPWPSETSLAKGTVRKVQPSLTGLGSYRFTKGAWTFFPVAGASFTALVVDGQGFVKNRTDFSPRWSIETGLRIGRTFGRWRPWLGVGASVFPWSQKIRIVEEKGSELAHADLPRLQLFIAVGLGVRVY